MRDKVARWLRKRDQTEYPDHPHVSEEAFDDMTIIEKTAYYQEADELLALIQGEPVGWIAAENVERDDLDGCYLSKKPDKFFNTALYLGNESREVEPIDIHGYSDVQIGVRIMANRKKAGFSQVELAEKVGCSQSAISQIENGERQPSFKMAKALLEACGASLVVRRDDLQPTQSREVDDG